MTARTSSHNARPRRSTRPIVFLGPSLAHEHARQILDAEYRFPVRRGDLDDIGAGEVVAIIDGVFDQQLAVTPTELRRALARGVRLFGASSMGALRAVEVPGVVGVGKIYAMYRDGLIDSDDEVAITFDPQSLRPLCEPLVNVRHAVERLAMPGTISAQLAARIVRAAQVLPYFERVYPRILARAGLDGRRDSTQLANMLASHDLKREDAITLLERLQDLPRNRPAPRHAPAAAHATESAAHRQAAPLRGPALVHCWEFGPPLAFTDILSFLALTGELRDYALRAYRCMAAARSRRPRLDLAAGPSLSTLYQRRLAQTARTWNWATEEEVGTSLMELGIDQNALSAALMRDLTDEQQTMAMCRQATPAFLEALRLQLFLDDLALKRAAARALSLRDLAQRSAADTRSAQAAGTSTAIGALCRQLDVRDQSQALTLLRWWGIEAAALDEFIAQLGAARRATLGIRPLAPGSRRAWSWLRRSPKASGSRRFCLPASQALTVVKRLRPVIGVTRVSMITKLGRLGIPNAQAFRPDGEWSSTVGSGKSESALGARVGAVMEEVEKWAQEQYSRRIDAHIACTTSYRALRRRSAKAVDPHSLDLPYDSGYSPDLEMPWVRARDLVSGVACLVPAAAVTHTRVKHDIYYSPQGGRKTVTTNGLASGLTLAEALTHALCEMIERHERALDAIVQANPGAPLIERPAILDLDTSPRSTRRLLDKIRRAGYRLVVRSIGADVSVPTFIATILLPDGSPEGGLFADGWQQAQGWACHPDPETAINMAILEASQTIMSHVAGAREDLTLSARSLGRHERTDSRRRAAFVPEFDVDAPRLSFQKISGFVSRDAARDVRWVVDRLAQAGFRQALMVDYSTDDIKPARVVRVLIPGMETINPFHTGLRARRALLADILGPMPRTRA